VCVCVCVCVCALHICVTVVFWLYKCTHLPSLGSSLELGDKDGKTYLPTDTWLEGSGSLFMNVAMVDIVQSLVLVGGSP
jgi:hypothetical protein